MGDGVARPAMGSAARGSVNGELVRAGAGAGVTATALRFLTARTILSTCAGGMPSSVHRVSSFLRSLASNSAKSFGSS